MAAVDKDFDAQDLQFACDRLSTIPRYPFEGRNGILLELDSMMPSREALDWVVTTVLAHCKVWPGMSEIRGLLCSRFEPADRIDEPMCNIPGFTVEEQEARYLRAHTERKRTELASTSTFKQIAAGVKGRHV